MDVADEMAASETMIAEHTLDECARSRVVAANWEALYWWDQRQFPRAWDLLDRANAIQNWLDGVIAGPKLPRQASCSCPWSPIEQPKRSN